MTVGAASGGGVPLSPAGLDTEKLWGGTILARVRVPGGGNIVTLHWDEEESSSLPSPAGVRQTGHTWSVASQASL